MMRWTDTQEIAMALEDTYPEADVVHLRFTDLHRWIVGLEGFTDDAEGSNERILEAIQMAWLAERD